MSFKVGDRVEDLNDGERGTVLFFGQVPPTKGEWLGVDWDKGDARGKHDGTHQEARYFQATSAKSGSFVRAHKVTKGTTFNEAVKGRYGVLENAGIDDESIDQVRHEIKAKFIEMVGFEKVNKQQGDFGNLISVGLSNRKIRELEEGQQPLLVAVRDLDISENLFRDWPSVVCLCSKLKKLKSLTVSGNRLTIPDSIQQLVADSLPLLEEIIMAEMGYTWAQCFEICSSLKSLQTMQLPHNNISEIPPIGDAFNELRVLNLSTNPITDWATVMAFSKLPKLKKLVLNECPFTEIFLSKNEGHFSCLEVLYICDSNLQDWTSISALEGMPNLRILRMKGSKLLGKETPQTSRQLVIARIAQLTNLNGTFIDSQERTGAEIDYLKKYGLDFLDKMENFDIVHPSYARLMTQYRWEVSRDEYKVQDTTLAAGLLSLVISCPDNPDFNPVVKKIPSTMIISKVKLLLQRVVKKKSHEMVLSYRSKDVEFEYPLDHDMRDLYHYDVENDGTIIVR